MTNAYLLETREVEKVWGRTDLPAPFNASTGIKIGEFWFEPTNDCPDLLIKYLFTSEKLSVQVHPSDAQAPGGKRGKEECWYILGAEPDARLAIGLTSEVGEDDLREAALDGSIESLLEWHPVSKGDFFYLPAGTIHAIGPGISLLEVQQNSDITYRLYDYGRPRELHLDDGLAVARREPYAAKWQRKVPASGDIALVEGPHFRMDRCTRAMPSGLTGGALVVPLAGTARIGDLDVASGQCGWAPDPGAVDLSNCPSAMVAATLGG